MLTILSFGGGQDSTAILLRLIHDSAFRARYAPDELIVVMADTGDEHPETLAHVDRMRALCSEANLRFEYLTFDRGFHSGPWSRGLEHFYRAADRIGSVAFAPTCSPNLKIEPMRRWLKSEIATRYGIPGSGSDKLVRRFVRYSGAPVRMILGIAAGEEKRLAKPVRIAAWVRDTIKNVYPLVEIGWGRAECQAYIASVLGDVPPPSNCMMCPFKSAQEILWTARRYPERWATWVTLERAKLDAHDGREKNYGVKKSDPLPSVLAKAQRDFGHWSDAQLDDYRMSHGHCVATTF